MKNVNKKYIKINIYRRKILFKGAAVMGGGVASSIGLSGCNGLDDASQQKKLTETINTTENFQAENISTTQAVNVSNNSDSHCSVPAISSAGTYIGNGSSLQIWVGFKPDLIIICPSIGKSVSYLTPTTWNGRTSYFSEATYGGGPTKPRGLIVNESGFSIGSLADVNTSGATFYWFAYKDNESGSFFDGDYRGNPSYMTPRTVELFKNKNIKAIILKRDNTPSAAHMFINEGCSDYKGNPVNASLNSDGSFVLGNEPIINTGESCNAMAFPDSSNNTFVFKYTGTGKSRYLSIPWEPDALIFMPITPATVRGGVWISGMGTQYKPMSNSGMLSGALTMISGTTIGLTAANNFNELGVNYICYAFKRSRGSLLPEFGNVYKTSKTIVTALNGYIDCGVSDTLRISGAISIEILCAHNQFDTTVFAGPDYNNEIGKQSPLIFRSDGADATMGSISFGLSVISQWPTTWSTGVPMPYPSITWAQSPIWQIWNGSISQQKCPIMSGIGSAPYILRHYLLTHDGHGKWRLYLDGILVKDCNDDLSKDPAAGSVPSTNIVGGSGHRLIIGGRKRDKVSIEQTNMIQLKEARIYSRELSFDEAMNNYKSIWVNGPLPVQDFSEEWLATNVSNGIIKATNHPENDGQIINGAVYG